MLTQMAFPLSSHNFHHLGKLHLHINGAMLLARWPVLRKQGHSAACVYFYTFECLHYQKALKWRELEVSQCGVFRSTAAASLTTEPYLSCVSPSLTLILPMVSCGFISRLPQGIMVCTRSHTLLHMADPSKCIFNIISSPKSLSRVMRKVRLLLPAMLSVLFLERMETKGGAH